MDIRPANNSDIPSIIELLKLSLGESLMPKSEDYWRWKHVDNPFGISPALVAEEGSQIIGVRAFMRWEWQRNNKRLTAIRAVDTATHPDHQRKGIFKKLTLALLEKCESDRIDMIYNTPNEQSKSGYLKMGWEEAGKLPVKLGIKQPMSMVFAKLFKSDQTRFITLSTNRFELLNAINKFSGSFEKNASKWITGYSKEYLIWRYCKIPVIQYYGICEGQALIVFRLKESGLGIELRICDVFGNTNDVNNLLKIPFSECSYDYVSITGFSDFKLPGLIGKYGKFGPDVTVRKLYNQDEVEAFIDFRGWNPSLGDLEVF